MPISSTEVQNILSSQVAMFASSAQYAQAVSAQYGYQPGGGGGVSDPRDNLQSGMMASGAVRGLDMGFGALGTAAMLGAAPRMFDPFTGTAGAAAAGYRAAGVSGMVGSGLAAGGAYLALASVYKWSADQLVAGAQERAVMNQQMGMLAPSLGSGQLNQMSAMVSGAARMGMGSIQDITGMMQAGAQDGSLNTQSLTQFQQSFQKLLGNVRQVASALSTSLTEAQQAMQAVKAIGISSDQAGNFLGSMRMIGQGAGFTPQQMYGIAAQGAQFGQQMGINRQGAAMGMMVNQGVLGMVERGGLIEGVGADSYGRYSQAAMRFLGSGRGQTVLAAMIGENGMLNSDVAAQVAAGTLSGAELRRMGTRNLSRGGMRDILNARSGELAGEFISQFGPQAIAPALQSMTGDAAYPETMRSMLSGLTRNELGQMGELNRMMPSLRSRLMEEGRAGFQEGTRRANFTESLDAAVNQLVGPFKDRLRQYGADLTQSVQQTIEGVTRDFMGSPPPAADPSTYQRYISSYMRGGGTNNLVYRRMQPFMNGAGTSYFNPSIPQAESFLGGMPTALRMGSMAPGVGFGDLPGFGLGTESYNPYITGVSGLANTGALGGLGRGLGALGYGITEATAGTATGFLGLGGVGTGVGLTRLGGFGLRGAGLGLRALGGVGMAIGAYDVATNLGPALSRGLGFSPIAEGAVMGDQAQLLEYISQNNLAGGQQLVDQPVGYFRGGGLSGGDTGGLVPVGGLIGDTNRQRFMTPEFRAEVNRLAAGAPGRIAEFQQQYGAAGRQALEFATLSSGSKEKQVEMIMRRLNMSQQAAQQLVMNAGLAGMTGQAAVFDETRERKALLASSAAVNYGGNTALQEDHAHAMSAMDSAIASARGLPTLDRFMAGLEEQGTPVGSQQGQLEMLRYMNKLAPGREDLNSRTVQSIIEGSIGPRGVGGAGGFLELIAKADVANWAAKNDADMRRLTQEQPRAAEGFRLAAVGSGMAPGIGASFLEKFTTGTDKDRIDAMQQFATNLATTPGVGSKGMVRLSRMLGRVDSEAAQRASVMAATTAQFRSLREGKAANIRYATELVGADLGGIDRKLLQREFKDIGQTTKFDPMVEAALTQQFMSMQTPGLYGAEASREAGTQMTQRLHDALVAQKSDPSKLAALAGEIATMRAQGGAGGSRPGETGKNMDELISRLGRFSEAVQIATDRIGGVGNPPAVKPAERP